MFMKLVVSSFFAISMSISASGTDRDNLTLAEIQISAIEGKTAVIPIFIDGEEHRAKVKGVLSLSTVKTGNDQSFAALEDLESYVVNNYCPPQYVPSGAREFNAGRSISLQLQEGTLSAAQVVRLKIIYRYHDEETLSSMSRTCL